MSPTITTACFLALLTWVAAEDKLPPYIRQCKENDPKLLDCIIKSLHHLRPYLAKGIPEIGMPSIEPFRLDSLSLSLTGGPKGYKITLLDSDMFGASSFTIRKIKLGNPFEAIVHIPKMSMDSHYKSSGVLLVIPASGNGTFHASMNDVTALVKGTVSTIKKSGKDYLHVDKMDLELTIKNIQMTVSNVFNNNKVLTEATNLFLKENGQEVLNIMMPQLRVRLAEVFKDITNNLLSNVPKQSFLISK